MRRKQVQPKCIGRVVAAAWNAKNQAIDFILELGSSGMRVAGTCQSGRLGTNEYISPADLKAKLPQFRQLKVYDYTGTLDPDKIELEQLQKLKFRISLRGGSIQYVPEPRLLDENAFLSRILG